MNICVIREVCNDSLHNQSGLEQAKQNCFYKNIYEKNIITSTKHCGLLSKTISLKLRNLLPKVKIWFAIWWNNIIPWKIQKSWRIMKSTQYLNSFFLKILLLGWVRSRKQAAGHLSWLCTYSTVDITRSALHSNCNGWDKGEIQ